MSRRRWGRARKPEPEPLPVAEPGRLRHMVHAEYGTAELMNGLVDAINDLADATGTDLRQLPPPRMVPVYEQTVTLPVRRDTLGRSMRT